MSRQLKTRPAAAAPSLTRPGETTAITTTATTTTQRQQQLKCAKVFGVWAGVGQSEIYRKRGCSLRVGEKERNIFKLIRNEIYEEGSMFEKRIEEQEKT